MNVKTRLAALDLVPRKKKGQNFLKDPSAARAIADFSGAGAGEKVLEIGPGLGALTQALLALTPDICVVELEEKLCDELRRTLFARHPERVFCADIREFSAQCGAEALGAEKITVVSNVPYSISTDVVLWVLTQRPFIKSACLLLQEEFAARLGADPGERACGSLSILRAMYADVDLGFSVGGEHFYPRAGVSSRLIKLRIRKEPALAVADPVYFEQVVRAAFSHRRKTLLNSLTGSSLGIAKKRIDEALHTAGIAGTRRAENLTLEEFAALALALGEIKEK